MSGPPGWYADPWSVETVRWWDGATWTHHTAPFQSVAAEQRPPATLPFGAAIGAVVLTIVALVGSRVVLEALGSLRLPVIAYVALSATLGYLPMLLFFVWAARRWGSGSLRDDFGIRFRWSDAGWGPVIWLAAICGEIAAAIVVDNLGIPLQGNTESIDDLSSERGVIIAILITAVVVAPIVEEIMFRGVVLRGLSSKLPVGVAIGVQGVLFGAAHVDPSRGTGNIGLVILLSTVGAVFGGAAVLLRRIGPTIIAHAVFNSVVMLIVFYVA